MGIMLYRFVVFLARFFLQFLMFLYTWGSDVGWRNDLVSLALFTKTRAFLR